MDTMTRPYTICYLNVSAECHIDGDFGRLPEAAPATEIFRQRWLELHADAIIYGAVTMALFTAGRVGELPKAEHTYSREDYAAPCEAGRYYVAISPDGGIAYDSPTIEVRNRGIHGIIHVLTEDISDDYIEYLRERGISYIFCGKEKLDPLLMMEKLYNKFGIKKAIISGGAYADWTLLSHGLIDEIKTMLVPVVDGGPHSNTLFKRLEGDESQPVALSLADVERVEGDGLMITYKPKNVRENLGGSIMKIGIIQTAPNNCAALDKIAARYPGLEIVHYVDGCLWEHYEAAGNVVNDKVNEILAGGFNKLIDAGCGSIGLLCNQIKSGIEKVQKSVALPILVYDDVLARRAVAATPNGGRIAVAAMNTAALGPTKLAVKSAAQQAEKNIEVETICVEAAKSCLEETGSTELADQYFERWLRENQQKYSSFVLPQVPLTRLMPRLRDMETPVFDSMKPFVDELAKM